MADKPAGELANELADQVRTLVQTEMKVAATELRGKAKQAGAGGVLLLVAGALLLYAVGVALTAAVLALSRVMPSWLAATVTSSLLGATAAVAGWVGFDRLRSALPLLPEKAVAGLTEDVQAVQDGLES
jgi:Putative Actinobacterial Holin-X, holin superfamily III